MPSNDSSRTEHPGDITSDLPNRCDSCGHRRREHTLADGACGLGAGFKCQHENAYQITGDKLRRPGRRLGYVCETCGEVWMVTAPRYCGADGSCRDPLKRCGLGCRRAADELSQQTQDMEPEALGEAAVPLETIPCEGCKPYLLNACKAFERCIEAQRRATEPKAPACSHESWEERNPGLATDGIRMASRWCADCGDYLGRFEATLPEREILEPLGPKAPAPVPVREDCGVCGGPHDSVDCPGPPIRGCDHPDGCQFEGTGCVNMCAYEGMPGPEAPVPAPRRPPYAVVYATEGGAQYEIALPGDASVRAVDGALIVTHDSAVLALCNVRPME